MDLRIQISKSLSGVHPCTSIILRWSSYLYINESYRILELIFATSEKAVHIQRFKNVGFLNSLLLCQISQKNYLDYTKQFGKRLDCFLATKNCDTLYGQYHMLLKVSLIFNNPAKKPSSIHHRLQHKKNYLMIHNLT